MNTFLASGNFFRLLIRFAKSLDPDQDRQDVGPDLDPNSLTHTLIVFLKDFFEKVNLKKKIIRRQQKGRKLPIMQRVKEEKCLQLTQDI